MRRLAEVGPDLDDDALRGLLRAPHPAAPADPGPGMPARSTTEAPPWVRAVFISSADGAATLDGRAGGLGSPADQRLLSLSRHDADVVLVGAGTVRAEGYEGALLAPESRRLRVRAGLPAHPPVAVVTGSLGLDPGSSFFTQAPARPWVITTRTAVAARPERAAALARHAEVVPVGEDAVDPHALVAALRDRGARTVHCEGGPRLFGALAAAGLVDELLLTVSPLLAGPGPGRVLAGAPGPGLPARMRPVHVLHEDGMLFLRLWHERHLDAAAAPSAEAASP